MNREVTGSSGGLYTLHGVWERPPANNLPQTPHSAGAYGTGCVLFFNGATGECTNLQASQFACRYDQYQALLPVERKHYPLNYSAIKSQHFNQFENVIVHT